MSTPVVDLLLIEDNPGDARLIEAMLPQADTLLHRVESAEGSEAEGLDLRHEKTLADGLAAIQSREPDAVLLDLGLPDSRGLETLTAVLEETSFLPVVVLTGLADEARGIEAIQMGAQEYLVKGEVSEDLLVRALSHAIERARQERDRARRQEELEALNRLNQVGGEITHAALNTDTREDLERAVCEHLVRTDRYALAWIGEVDRRADRVIPRMAAGEDCYLEHIEAIEAVHHPATRAMETHEIHVRRGLDPDAEEAWQAAAVEAGFASIAAVPIEYEGLLYGVLSICATTEDSFSPHAVDVLERLGDVIGHAITALERKDALIHETVIQLEFGVEGFLDEVVELAADRGGAVRFENLVIADQVIVYGHAEGIPSEPLIERFEAADPIDAVRILAADDTWCKFEVATDVVRPLSDAVSSHGGSLGSAWIESGAFRFTVEFPTGRDKRQLIDLVQRECPDATHHAQRTVERSPDEVGAVRGALNSRLTEKQRQVLRAAYHAGFFEWPRESSGQEVAERLGIAPATFSQHIRTAEQKVFNALFDGLESNEERPIASPTGEPP